MTKRENFFLKVQFSAFPSFILILLGASTLSFSSSVTSFDGAAAAPTSPCSPLLTVSAAVRLAPRGAYPQPPNKEPQPKVHIIEPR